MLHNQPHLGRTSRLAIIVALGITTLSLALSLPAFAYPSLFGGKLFYSGGDVTVDVLHSDTIYDEVLQLRAGDIVLDLGAASQVGASITLTQEQLADLGIKLGDELDLGLHVRTTGYSYMMGPGDRNADGFDHAYVRPGRDNVYVMFEDLYGGGDRDYNDVIFRFSGGVRTSFAHSGPGPSPAPGADRTGRVPEPLPAVLLLTGIGVLGWMHRKR